MKKKMLTTREIAGYCDVTIHTVNKWINAGKLDAYKTPGNHRKIDKEVFFDFLKKYNMPIPEEFESKMIRKKRILVVDDDKVTVQLIKKLLAQKDIYEIESAQDGFEAGLKFISFKPDLITLDLKMPQMNGFQVCSCIRDDPKNDGVRIIVISSHLDDKNKKKIFDLGADDYLSKPFKAEDIQNKIEKLLNRKDVNISL